MLLRTELHERFRAVFEEEFDPRETYPFVDRVMADDDVKSVELARAFASRQKPHCRMTPGAGFHGEPLNPHAEKHSPSFTSVDHQIQHLADPRRELSRVESTGLGRMTRCW